MDENESEQTRIAELQDIVDNSDATIAMLKANNRELSTRITDLMTSVGELKRDKEGLAGNLATALTEKTSLLESCRAEKSALESNLATAQAETSAVKSTLEASQAEKSVLEGNLATAQVEIGAAKSKMEASQAEKVALKNDLATAQVEIGAVKSTLEAIQAEKSALEWTLATAQKESRALRSTLKACQAENSALEATNLDLTGKMSELEAENASLSSSATELETQNIQLKTTLIEYEEGKKTSKKEVLRLQSLEAAKSILGVTIAEGRREDRLVRLLVNFEDTINALGSEMKATLSSEMGQLRAELHDLGLAQPTTPTMTTAAPIVSRAKSLRVGPSRCKPRPPPPTSSSARLRRVKSEMKPVKPTKLASTAKTSLERSGSRKRKVPPSSCSFVPAESSPPSRFSMRRLRNEGIILLRNVELRRYTPSESRVKRLRNSTIATVYGAVELNEISLARAEVMVEELEQILGINDDTDRKKRLYKSHGEIEKSDTFKHSLIAKLAARFDTEKTESELRKLAKGTGSRTL